jgi:anti-anti-sigma factor
MITSEIIDNKSVVTFENVKKLNFLNIEEIAACLKWKLEETDKDMYLDLTGIRFVDSSASGKLIAIHRFASSMNRKFRLFNASKELKEIFLYTGISKKLCFADIREVYENQNQEYRVTYL